MDLSEGGRARRRAGTNQCEPSVRAPGAKRRAGSPPRAFSDRFAFCPSYRAFGLPRAPSRRQFFRDFAAFAGRIHCGLPNPSGLTRFTLQCHMADMNKIKTVCVYCGSGPGTNPRFVEAAIALGKVLAENGIRLVYGGGSVGLMGAVANIRARSWRHRHRHHSGLSHRARKRADAGSGNDRHARHARAQAADVRALRRLRRAARRHRHAGGTGRATDLAATRPPHQAGAARQHRRFLGAAAGAAGAYARHRSSSARP